MPKKIPIAEKREWLELYEKGQSEAAIATAKNRDLNVIKRGIQEARNERNLSLAQAGMLKDALRQHQDKLLAVMQAILGAVIMPSSDLELPRKLGDAANPIILPGARIEYDPQVGLFITLKDESNVHWQLLKEHLRRDRLWGKLEQWKKVMIDHLRARIDLRLKAKTLLEGSTALRVLDVIDNAPGNDFLYFAAVDLFYRIILKEAIQAPNRESFNEGMVLISEPYIKYEQGAIPLAHCSKSHHKACRANIIDAFKKFEKSTEVGKIKATYKELSDITDKARKIAEEINLLGLIPGQCRVCRRLGM
jgi:hypothetical protein